MDVVAESARLILRELVVEDLQSVLAYTGDGQVSRYQAWAPHSEANAKDWIKLAIAARLQRPRQMYYWGICVKDSGQLIGGLGIDLLASKGDSNSRMTDSAEIGYSLNQFYCRQGYGTEAVLAGLRYVFRHTQIQRVVAHCRDSNFASIALLEKLRFTREGHFVDDIEVRGRLMSSYWYAMLRGEFLDFYRSHA